MWPSRKLIRSTQKAPLVPTKVTALVEFGFIGPECSPVDKDLNCASTLYASTACSDESVINKKGSLMDLQKANWHIRRKHDSFKRS